MIELIGASTMIHSALHKFQQEQLGVIHLWMNEL
jgi:hypothetical protein